MIIKYIPAGRLIYVLILNKSDGLRAINFLKLVLLRDGGGRAGRGSLILYV
jgi:prolipoprotein diacylglyceryltransferase